jgi:glycine/D-amino acid oxidase-like deaminating enzyme
MSAAEQPIHDWAIIGGGGVGIFLAEILTREGHSVALIEKNALLAGETTRDFHEWIHMGSLYTLIPDNLKTLKFLLGAIDDILEFYSGYPAMNLVPTERGMRMRDAEGAWFNENHIHFRFRIAERKLALPWLLGVARAVFLIDRIKEHDWLRRRAGVLDPFALEFREIGRTVRALLRHREKFYDYETPDFTTNSRNLLGDLVRAAVARGLAVSTSNPFVAYRRAGEHFEIECARESVRARNIVFANGANIAAQLQSDVKLSYAPMAVIKNVPAGTPSFVELDYFPKNCINILTKDNGVALIGGISFSDPAVCDAYVHDVIARHREYNPNLEVLETYVGIKSELVVTKRYDRNYLYHILNLEQNVWGIIPGKFTSAFSIAPEFYRRVYKRNPARNHPAADAGRGADVGAPLVANTVWYDATRRSTSVDQGASNGHDQDPARGDREIREQLRGDIRVRQLG